MLCKVPLNSNTNVHEGNTVKLKEQVDLPLPEDRAQVLLAPGGSSESLTFSALLPTL